jgi:hypothetical protein
VSPACSTVLFTNVLVPRRSNHVDAIDIHPRKILRKLSGGEKGTWMLGV